MVRGCGGYPTDHPGVSGLYVPPWSPGYVTNEFGIIGHETATEGDLGEFIVIHANNGQWKIWTADGLLAGSILLHLGDPTSRSRPSLYQRPSPARLDRPDQWPRTFSRPLHQERTRWQVLRACGGTT